MSKRKNHQNKPKQSEVQPESRVLSVLKSRPVLVIRLILEILGVVMTAQFFWPKFSVVPSSAWDSSNPIQSTFTIKNDSNFGCYEVTSNFGSNITVHSNAVLGAPVSIIPRLCPPESSTISIEKIITTSANAIDEAEVYINLTYRTTFIPITFPTKSFRFKARKTPSGYIWEPMYMDRMVK
ncbi:MAG: hypothetical protein PH343_08680 [Nitrospira sp.]|nr:hypothetical protein [Nitrospira sp.]